MSQKTKLFTGYFSGEKPNRKFHDVDKEVNEFLGNNSVEVIDVKFCTSPDGDGEQWHSALLIYKEKLESSKWKQFLCFLNFNHTKDVISISPKGEYVSCRCGKKKNQLWGER